MRMPGFTAEFSLCNTEKSYQLTVRRSSNTAGQIVAPQYNECDLYSDGRRYCCDSNTDFCYWVLPAGSHRPLS